MRALLVIPIAAGCGSTVPAEPSAAATPAETAPRVRAAWIDNIPSNGSLPHIRPHVEDGDLVLELSVPDDPWIADFSQPTGKVYFTGLITLRGCRATPQRECTVEPHVIAEDLFDRVVVQTSRAGLESLELASAWCNKQRCTRFGKFRVELRDRD